MPAEARTPSPSVKSAERTLLILERLARSGEPLSFSAIQRELGIPKSSLHALVATMQSRGWLSADPSGTRFGLGHRARLLSQGSSMDTDLLVLIDDLLEDLRDQVDETVHLACLDGPDILYVTSKYSRHALGVRFHTGRRLPAHATALGKALLAALRPAQLRDHLPERYDAMTSNTITTEDALLAALERVRGSGVAVDGEESALGLRCFAAALPHPQVPLHAISCSCPTARLDADKEQQIITAIRETREKALARLGHNERSQ